MSEAARSNRTKVLPVPHCPLSRPWPQTGIRCLMSQLFSGAGPDRRAAQRRRFRILRRRLVLSEQLVVELWVFLRRSAYRQALRSSCELVIEIGIRRWQLKVLIELWIAIGGRACSARRPRAQNPAPNESSSSPLSSPSSSESGAAGAFASKPLAQPLTSDSGSAPAAYLLALRAISPLSRPSLR